MIRVGMEPNWVPFEYVDGAGQLAGFDVALARELGTRLGIEVQFVANLSFDGLYDALTASRVDVVISAVVKDPQRAADFTYSIPYFEAGQVLVVSANARAIESLESLDGGILAVELGSEGDSVARRWARRLMNLSLLHTDSANDALNALVHRRADAALVDRATALMALKEFKNASGPSVRPGDASNNLKISGRPVTSQQYAVVMRRESSALLQILNAALAEMHQDGTLKQLEREWLGP